MSAPKKLGPSGKALVASVRKGLPRDLELDEREEALLDLAARQADDVARLEADIAERGTTVPGSRASQMVLNPSLSEARQGRLALGKLLGMLSLPDEAGQPRTAPATRARRAAQARWKGAG